MACSRRFLSLFPRLRHPDKGRPYAILGSTELARAAHHYVLRDDRLRFPDGAEAVYSVVTSPDSAFVVPMFADGDTMLVRQWRHAWDVSSWEVPAGSRRSTLHNSPTDGSGGRAPRAPLMMYSCGSL